MSVIEKISEFGNSFFEWLIKGIVPLPGVIKGVIVIVTFLLISIGIFTLLKKSFKVFGIILLAIFIVVLVSMFLT